MYIDVVTKEIDDARQTIKNLQPTIRAFVTNKDFPLEERFRVWKDYAEKVEHDCIIGGEVKVLGQMVEDQFPPYRFEDRHKEYDWCYFFYTVVDAFHEKWGNKDIINYVSSVDEFKEVLIETNFGSFYMDW